MKCWADWAPVCHLLTVGGFKLKTCNQAGSISPEQVQLCNDSAQQCYWKKIGVNNTKRDQICLFASNRQICLKQTTSNWGLIKLRPQFDVAVAIQGCIQSVQDSVLVFFFPIFPTLLLIGQNPWRSPAKLSCCSDRFHHLVLLPAGQQISSLLDNCAGVSVQSSLFRRGNFRWGYALPWHSCLFFILHRMDDAEACFILSSRNEVDRTAAVSAAVKSISPTAIKLPSSK